MRIALLPLALLLLLCASPLHATDAEAARTLTNLLTVFIDEDQRVQVMSTADLRAVVELEGEKQQLGCDSTSSSCLAEVAGAMGASFVVIGELGKLGTQWLLTINLFDSNKNASTSRVVARGSDVGGVADALPAQVKRLLEGLQVEEGKRAKLLVLDIKAPEAAESVVLPEAPIEDKRTSLDDERHSLDVAAEKARIAEERVRLEAERELAEERTRKAQAEVAAIEATRKAEEVQRVQAERDRQASQEFWAAVWGGVGAVTPWIVGAAGVALMFTGPILWGIESNTGAYPIAGVDKNGQNIVAAVGLVVGSVVFLWVVGPPCFEFMDDEMDAFDDDNLGWWFIIGGTSVMLLGPIFWLIEESTGGYPIPGLTQEDEESFALIAAVVGGSIALGGILAME